MGRGGVGSECVRSRRNQITATRRNTTKKMILSHSDGLSFVSKETSAARIFMGLKLCIELERTVPYTHALSTLTLLLIIAHTTPSNYARAFRLRSLHMLISCASFIRSRVFYRAALSFYILTSKPYCLEPITVLMANASSFESRTFLTVWHTRVGRISCAFM